MMRKMVMVMLDGSASRIPSIYGERTGQNTGGNKDHNSELGLTRQFNGTCHNCGQQGHKKADCP